MSTTIQVSDTTKQMLDLLKEKTQIKTNNQLIALLLDEKMNLPKSMFGAAKGIGKWKKEDRAEFREL